MRKILCRILVLWALFLLWIGVSGAAARADSTPFRFAVVADSRSNHNNPSVNSAVLRQLIADMNALNPAFCLFPGDLVYGGKIGNDAFKRELQEWVAATSDFKGIIYVTPGNHELKGTAGRADAWREMLPNMPANGPPGEQYKCSYYFDYGNSRFISVLSDWEDGGARVDQNWLDQILGASSGFEHVFVFSHHPIRDLGGSRGAFWKSLVSHRVDAYFCGHLHFYNRLQPGDDNTWQVIVGTAGAPQYAPAPSVTGTTIPSQYGFATVDVDGPNVMVTFYGDTDGDGHYNDVMDSFVLSRPSHAEEVVPGNAPVRSPASTPDRRGCLMPSF